ncbi:MAG: magnesium/cobalt transporter CorA [Gammaproteobacteria bacterium]
MTYFTKRYHPPGTVPGTLVHHETLDYGSASIGIINYSRDELVDLMDSPIEDCRTFLAGPNTTWVHVQGQSGPEVLGRVGDALGLPALALEDIANVGQRPKAEIYENQVFVILSLPYIEGGTIRIEQISLFLGDHYVVSFAGGVKNPFIPIHDRLKIKNGRIRARNADYLLYTLVDLVIDQGFPVLEKLGSLIENLEDEVLEAPDKKTLTRIHLLKRELLLLRRMLWPHLESLTQLMRNENDFISEKTQLFFRDCYDHVVHIIELIETYRETLSSMQELYLSTLSNRLNEIMRVLTVIATIFIPLTFVAGIYGMNFDYQTSPWNMPELHWYYGYPIILGLMGLVVIGLLVLFRRKGWI